MLLKETQDKLLPTLKTYFGYDSFRDQQEQIVESVLLKNDNLVIMPTGGGKSLCFQLPALCIDGLTVVISPLIALMRDQVRALNAFGVSAGSLSSGNTEAETEEVFQALDEGRLKLLYIAPERLANPGTVMLLRKVNTRLIAVDEKGNVATGDQILAVCAKYMKEKGDKKKRGHLRKLL